MRVGGKPMGQNEKFVSFLSWLGTSNSKRCLEISVDIYRGCDMNSLIVLKVLDNSARVQKLLKA